jgi:hypothetical protein
MTNPRFKERWEHELSDWALCEFLGIPGACVTIGFFDQWAKTRATELGLRLVATDDFEFWRDDHDRKIRMRATVLLEDAGDAAVIDVKAERMHDMGLVPYIRQIEAK